MPSYSRTTTIAVDQDTAYAYLSKAENLPEYFPRITKVTTRGGDEVETTAVIEPPGEEKRTVHGTAWFKSRRQRAEGLVGLGGLERLPRRARLRPGRRRVLHGAAHAALRERPPRHRGVDRRDPRDDLEHAHRLHRLTASAARHHRGGAGLANRGRRPPCRGILGGMRSHCALYIDVGYLIAASATRVTGTSLRSGVVVSYPDVVKRLIAAGRGGERDAAAAGPLVRLRPSERRYAGRRAGGDRHASSGQAAPRPALPAG